MVQHSTQQSYLSRRTGSGLDLCSDLIIQRMLQHGSIKMHPT